MTGPTRARSDARHERPPAPVPLPRPVVDSHCHLDIAAGEDWLPVDEALQRSAAVGVPRVVQIGCDLVGAPWAADTAEAHEQVVAGVALHPNEAPRLSDLDGAFEVIAALARAPRVRAVGETGLDYFRTAADGRPAQQESFRRHLDLAKRLDKTVVVHDRDAHDDVLRVVDEEGVPDRLVMHCFSGDPAFARSCLDRGFWLSFAGTVTFKNAGELREALALVPTDRVLVETDAPYLTPTPHRGSPNASYLVPLTVRAMAEVRGEDLEELCAAIERNTFEAFGGAW